VKETDVPGAELANAGVASPVTRPAVISAAAIFVIRRPARLLIVVRFTFPLAMLFIFIPVFPGLACSIQLKLWGGGGGLAARTVVDR
jgi:hypothetical protein